MVWLDALLDATIQVSLGTKSPTLRCRQMNHLNGQQFVRMLMSDINYINKMTPLQQILYAEDKSSF